MAVEAKSHYASWFGAGSKLVRSQIQLRYLVRTSSEPASVMEFGFYRLKQYRPSVVCRSVTIVIPAKTDTVWDWTRVGPGNCVLDDLATC